MRVLDLFSGIGGFSLGFQRCGFETTMFCEIDKYCQKVLAKNFPGVPIHDNIKTLTGDKLPKDIDLICGGFPCQDISVAGKRRGIIKDETRSGLWFEMARVISEVRPKYVIVENVAALLNNGMGVVLGELSEMGYDAEWGVISARDVGAPHLRKRVWILGYPKHDGSPTTTKQGSIRQAVCDDKEGQNQTSELEGASTSSMLAYTTSKRLERNIRGLPKEQRLTRGCGSWPTEPDVGRVAHGIPNRVDRIKGLGNAVVPQIPELIGRVIKEEPCT